MGSQTLSTTKSFGAGRQVLSVCLSPATPRGDTDTLWKEICPGNAPGEMSPQGPAHGIPPNGTALTSGTQQPPNNQKTKPLLSSQSGQGQAPHPAAPEFHTGLRAKEHKPLITANKQC